MEILPPYVAKIMENRSFWTHLGYWITYLLLVEQRAVCSSHAESATRTDLLRPFFVQVNPFYGEAVTKCLSINVTSCSIGGCKQIERERFNHRSCAVEEEWSRKNGWELPPLFFGGGISSLMCVSPISIIFLHLRSKERHYVKSCYCY